MRPIRFGASLILFFSFIIGTKAQQTIPATGGEAVGSGGSVSYSIGQVFYTTTDGTNTGSVAHGVLQPYEISVVTGINAAKGINLQAAAYPNPTTDHLTIKVANYDTGSLQYLVFNLNGKLLQTVKATGAETIIATSGLVQGVYFIKVLDESQEIKVFKVIKR